MIAPILLVVAFAGLALIVRGAQRRGADEIAVGAIGYVAAAGVSWLVVGVSGTTLVLPAVGIGALGGASCALGFVLLASAMKTKGAAIAAAAMNLGVLVPILAAVAVWGERPGLTAIIGIILAVIAMPVLALDKGIDHEPLTPRRVGLLLAVFLVNGSVLAFSDWFHAYGLLSARPLYVAVFFTVAAISAAVYWRSHGERLLRRQEMAWGGAARGG